MHLANFAAMALAVVSASGIAVPLSIQVSLDEHDLGHAHTSMGSSQDAASNIVNDIAIWSTQCELNTRMLQGLSPVNIPIWVPQIVHSYQARGNEMVASMGKMKECDKIQDSDSKQILEEYRDFTQMFEREMSALTKNKLFFHMFNYNIPAVAALRLYESAMDGYVHVLSGLVSSSEAENLKSQYRRVEDNLTQAIKLLNEFDY